MSGESPASVLFSSDGIELAVVQDAALPVGTRGILTDGYVSLSYPSYTDQTTNLLSLTTIGQLRALSDQGAPNTLANAWPVSLTDGYGALFGQSNNPIWVDINGTVTVTGTIAATQSGAWTVAATQSGAWTVTSNQGTPNTLANAWPITITDGYGNIQGSSANPVWVEGTITASNPSVGTDGGIALGFDTQVGGITSTNAPTYTTGNLDALSLTTLGGLRIDGVYAVGTVNATAADVMNSGGYVTTTAPTYTTGQLNPLSLDTAGNLRVTGFIVTDKAATSAFTTVAGATSSTAILAANATRIKASIYNNTNKNMFVLYNSGAASTTNFSIMIMKGSYVEVPDDYTGAINAIWDNGVSGSANVTEFSP